jgi:hypothetical protein
MRWSMGLVLFVAAWTATLTASDCEAQAAPSVDGRGKHFIVAETFSNTSIGFGLRAGDRTDVMLELAGRVFEDGGTRTRLVSLRPALKRYLGSTEGSVAPYLFLGLRADWSWRNFSDSPVQSSRALGGRAGVGVDWFPTQRVSIGGHVGAEAVALRSDGTLLGGPDAVSTGHDVGTFSSGIRVRLFF